MRLAAVSHSGWLGGAERCLAELVAVLADRHDVHVVVPADGPLVPLLRGTVHVAPARWWAREAGQPWRGPDLAGAARVARVLRAVRPDVVLSNTLVAPSGALAAAALRLPHLWWVHEHGDRDHGYRFPAGHAATLRLVRALSAGVLVSSGAVAQRLPSAWRVPYGIPVEPGAVRGAVGDPPRVAIAGRVRPSKGQADAVRAVAALSGVHLDVVGDGELGALRALARELGVADRVHVRGPVDDALATFDAADVVLLCSRDEAFGRVVVEAAKRGRPVVAARSAGVPVTDGRTGLLYAPGDVPALTAAIGRLLGDDALRRRLAAAGQRHALAAFTMDRQAAAVEAAMAAVRR